MRITMLGTGHAVVTECYNTCFVLSDDEGHALLVDGGGGSGIVEQMARAGIAWHDIHEVFVTHRHIDHILGIVWVLRMVGMGMRRGTYEGSLRIVGNAQTIHALKMLARELLGGEDAGLPEGRIRLEVVEPGSAGTLAGRPVTYFDTHAHDVDQLGFCMTYEPGRMLACCGDVALKEQNLPLVQGATWLLHEAFSCRGVRRRRSYIVRGTRPWRRPPLSPSAQARTICCSTIPRTMT